jgi:thioredoxin 1
MVVGKNKVIHLNTPSFEKAINNGICLVDFWAEWCAPCRMQGPIIDEVASQLNGDILFAKVNVDDNRQIAAKYGIMSIPTLIIFNKGKIVKQFVGVQPATVLLSELKNL